MVQNRKTLLATSLAALWAVAALASAQAEEARPGRHGPEGAEHGPGGRSGGNIFFSPMGKPYRGKPGAPYAVALWFDAANASHDGKLTLEQFRADAKAFFAELDTNHDGVIDGFEVSDYETDVAPEILPNVGRLHPGEGFDPNLDLGERGPGRREGGGGRRRGGGEGGAGRTRAGDEIPQGAGLFSLINEPEPVSSADTDFSGKISLAKWMAAADRRFKLLDQRNLGYLTLAELPHTPVQALYERRLAAHDQPHDPPHDGPPRPDR